MVAEVFTLLNREIELYRYTAAFPEWCVKKFCKDTGNHKWKAYGKGVVEMCTKYTVYAKRKRTELGKAPKDVGKLEWLLEQGGKDMGERLEDIVKEEKRMEEISKPIIGGKKKKDEGEKKMVKRKGEEEEKEGGKKRKKKKRERTVLEGDVDMKDIEDDHVKEGLDWSDDE